MVKKRNAQPWPKQPERVSAFPVTGNCHPMKPRAFGTTKAVVQTAFDQAGGITRVMDLLGTGKSQTYGFTDDGEPSANLSLDRARWLTRNYGVMAFAEDMAAQAGCALMPVRAESEQLLTKLVADAQQKSGGLAASLICALEDGVITDAERRELLEILAGLISTLINAQHNLITSGSDNPYRS